MNSPLAYLFAGALYGPHGLTEEQKKRATALFAGPKPEKDSVDEPTYTVEVKMSVIVSGWANANSPLSRRSITELVADRIANGDVQSLIDAVNIIEVRDDNNALVTAPHVLGKW